MALGGFPSLREAALGFACGFFISGSALVSNDYFDLEVDKVNVQQRSWNWGGIIYWAAREGQGQIGWPG